jgi:hypothetical protein
VIQKNEMAPDISITVSYEPISDTDNPFFVKRMLISSRVPNLISWKACNAEVPLMYFEIFKLMMNDLYDT